MARVKILLAAVLLCFLPSLVRAQGTVIGREQVLQFTGTNVPIAPAGTPAQSFSQGGNNTFIIPLANPTVSLRIYITNNTANSCPSVFSVQMFAASDAQTNSFNNALANWQTVPLQSATGGIVGIAFPNIPASGIAYVSSTAISAPKVAVQILNMSNACSTTNIEITGVISQVSVTSPLISANSPGAFNSAVASNVQGVVPQQQNGSSVFPIVNGALELPINSSFVTTGIDNFATNVVATQSGGPGTFVVFSSIPPPTQPNEVAIMLEYGWSDLGTSTFAPSSWICFAGNCGQTNSVGIFSLQNANTGTPFVRTLVNGNINFDSTTIIDFTSPLTAIRQVNAANSSPASFTANTIAGSTLLLAIGCNFIVGGPCGIATVTDTQGNVWKQLTLLDNGNNQAPSGFTVWATTTQSTAAADTVTITMKGTSTIARGLIAEVTGITAAPLNTPAISLAADPLGNAIVRQDAQAPNQFNCTVTLTTTSPAQCQPAPTTINNVPVRLYVTDWQIQTTVAGTATNIVPNAGTGTNCGTGTTFFTNIFPPNTTIGIQSFLSFRTPFVLPIQNALCVSQLGTTAGTSVVEFHGFIAP